VKIKRTISLILVCVLLLTAPALADGAGSASDPLVTRSYADGSFRSSVMAAGRMLIDSAVDAAAFVFGAGPGASTGSFRPVSLSSGGTVILELGDSVVLLSGSAEIKISRGAVIDLSAGTTVSGGALSPYSRYLAAEDSYATVTALEHSLLAVDGGQVGGGESVSPFKDVSPDKWYYSYIVNAVEQGLINGKTADTYEPASLLRVSEAVKLASCLNQLHSDGRVTLAISGSPWYRAYVDYALEKGIIAGEYADYTADITRGEFVHIFYHSMPASSYTAINTVSDGAVPDVAMSDEYAGEIYALYRAGILTGDENGFFHAGTTILRSEVAAILYRMYQPSARRSVDLG